MGKINYRKYHRDKDYEKFESHFRNIFGKRFNEIERFSKNNGTILDIGASTGTMLDLFAEKGWETWGVEPSESAIIARQKGHKVIKEFFEEAKLPKYYFDAVIMNHTLEHMDNPVKILQKVKLILKAGGLLLVDVPNAGGFGSRILKEKWPYRLPQEHKHQFTKTNLERVFTKAGFNVIHFESRSGIFEFADPIKEIIDSLLSLKKRFFFNLFTFPYALIATIFNAGDSMSMIGSKEK